MSNRTSLWTFSFQLYSRPGVADVCLDLQDRFAVDVNVLLYLLWQASQRRRLDEADIRKVMELVADWQRHVVAPLRGVRRFLKAPARDWPIDDVCTFRQQIKADELRSEELQQQMMEALFPDMGTPEDVVVASKSNCSAYAQALAVQFPQEHVASLIARLEGKV